MGFFNFIETSFFISLGITFVLILLLVYHFKERMGTLEKKCDSLLEIINNIVKEINTVRNVQMNMNRGPFSFMNHMNPSDMAAPVVSSNSDTFRSNHLEKIQVNITDSDDEDEDTDTDTDTDEEDSDNEDMMHPLEEIQDSYPNIHFDYMELPETVTNENSTIKVINVDIETVDIREEFIDELEPDHDEDQEEGLEPLKETENVIQVEKMEPLEKTDIEEEEEPAPVHTTTEISKEVYRKMNLQTLKTFVITKGLCSDPSKMKKVDLLKLIETEMFASTSVEPVST